MGDGEWLGAEGNVLGIYGALVTCSKQVVRVGVVLGERGFTSLHNTLQTRNFTVHCRMLSFRTACIHLVLQPPIPLALVIQLLLEMLFLICEARILSY
jgi:hypothetical protein